jgi:branched-subunit amino acid ABC-type transport system permease component
MSVFLAQLINGIATGAIYALLVLGVNLLVVVRGIVYFSYPHVVMAAMAAGWLVLKLTGGNIALAIPMFFVSATILMVITEPLFRPLVKKGAFLETVVMATGIGIILTDVLSQFVNNGSPAAFPGSLRGGGVQFNIGLVSFSLATILAVVGGVVAVSVLLFFLYRTKSGRGIRAMAQNQRVARLLGVPFNKTGIIGFAVAGILAGFIALLLAMTLGSTSAALGDSYAVKGMILVLFAGMGNLRGGLIGAVVMGIAETVAMFYLPGRWSQTVFFGVLMLVILWRPQGVFGARA